MVAVKGAYFEECADRQVAFRDRASIPRSRLFSGEEAVGLWLRHGFKFLSVVSYSWLSREHPDPDGFHLSRLARIVAELKAYHGMDEVGIIIDFCSLWQALGENDTRTDEQ